jgi:hypothetical protein
MHLINSPRWLRRHRTETLSLHRKLRSVICVKVKNILVRNVDDSAHRMGPQPCTGQGTKVGKSPGLEIEI